MSQTYTADSFDDSHEGLTDLQNMETNFQALKTNFSGLSAPSSPVAFQRWGDIGDDILKIRNADDDGWDGLFPADTDQKVWVYRNSAMDGWAVVPGLSDRVVSLKGTSGTTYLTGGAPAGSWVIPWPDHVHRITDLDVPTPYYRTWDVDGDPVDFDDEPKTYQSMVVGDTYHSGELYTSYQSDTASSDWRPAAAVGTLQQMDLS